MYLCIHTPLPKEDNTIYWVSFENNRINSVPTSMVFPRPSTPPTLLIPIKSPFVRYDFWGAVARVCSGGIHDAPPSSTDNFPALADRTVQSILIKDFDGVSLSPAYSDLSILARGACRIFNYFPLCRCVAITITNNFLRTFQYTTIGIAHILFLPTDFSFFLYPKHIILSSVLQFCLYEI